MIRFLGRQTRHAIRRAARGLLRHEAWCIGIAEEPIESFLQARGEKRIRWLDPPERGRFIADPFGAQVDGATHILYEDFRYATSKGVIATVEATATGTPRTPKIAIELPVHASYPYLVLDRGEVYCIPETNEAREIGLYRAIDFPTRWEKLGTLISGVAALDPHGVQGGARGGRRAVLRGPVSRWDPHAFRRRRDHADRQQATPLRSERDPVRHPQSARCRGGSREVPPRRR